MLDITVVIPFYNRITFLESALKCISCQSVCPKRVIVIDDCSIHFEELNRLVSLEYPYELIILRNEINSGVSSSRNIGTTNSNTKYVAFLDEDDIWHPEKLRFQYTLMERNGFAFTSTLHHDKEIDHSGIDLDKIQLQKLTFNGVLFRNRINTSSVMIRKDLYLKYKFNPTFRYSEDYELWLRILKNHEVYLIPVPLTIRRNDRHHNGLSSRLYKMYSHEIRAIDLAVESRFLKLISKTFTTIKFIKRLLINILTKLRIQ